jgi:hypothetical protein
MCSTRAREADFTWLLPVPLARRVNTGVSRFWKIHKGFACFWSCDVRFANLAQLQVQVFLYSFPREKMS